MDRPRRNKEKPSQEKNRQEGLKILDKSKKNKFSKQIESKKDLSVQNTERKIIAGKDCGSKT